MTALDLFVIFLIAVLIVVTIFGATEEIKKCLRDIAGELHKLNKLLKQ